MKWKGPYRSLLIVYCLAIVAGVYEFRGARTGKRSEPDIYGDRARNFPEAMAKLYPGSAEAEYFLGRRFEASAGRRFNPGGPPPDRQTLQKLLREMNADLREAARHYEQALAMGMTGEENLQYNYALTLIRLRADPAEIDRAIASWRRNFPKSEHRDLVERRKTIEKQLRALPLGPASDWRSEAQIPSRRGEDTISGNVEGDVAAALDPVLEWRRPPGYVGSHVCGKCHPDQFESYLATGHSRALQEVDPEHEPPDARFDHAPSGRRYRVSRRDGRLFHDETLLLEDGTEFPLTSTPVRYRVGSGRFARTYLCDAGGGFLTESPVSWYASGEKWGMTPGYDKPAHRAFSRQILENCLWCHGGLVETARSSQTRLRLVEESIGCERCHGPGAEHAERQAEGATDGATAGGDTIVNPRTLPRRIAEGVCQQCHLQGDIQIGGRGVRAGDYRPGQPLERFSTAFRFRSHEGMTVVGHGEQLQASTCYRRSETMTCTSCHDPHAPLSPATRVEHYRSACMTCHAEHGCNLPLAARNEQAGNDCIHCHMPRSGTEVPHVAFTHHRIGLHPLNQEPGAREGAGSLVPLSDLSSLDEPDRERAWMLARLQMVLMRGPAFQRTDSGRELARQIADWFAGLSQAESDAETEFARFQLEAYRGNQHEAEQSAARTLALSDLRSEEAAVLLEYLAQRDLASGRYDRAGSRFAQLARLRLKGEDWFLLATCEKNQGRPEAARQAFERARELEPAAVEIYEALAELHRSRKDAVAEEHMRRTAEKLQRLRVRRSER